MCLIHWGGYQRDLGCHGEVYGSPNSIRCSIICLTPKNNPPYELLLERHIANDWFRLFPQLNPYPGRTHAPDTFIFVGTDWRIYQEIAGWKYPLTSLPFVTGRINIVLWRLLFDLWCLWCFLDRWKVKGGAKVVEVNDVNHFKNIATRDILIYC